MRTCTFIAILTALVWAIPAAAQSLAGTDAQVSPATRAVHPWPASKVIEDLSPDSLARVAAMRREWKQEHVANRAATQVVPEQTALPFSDDSSAAAGHIESHAVTPLPAPADLPPARAEQQLALLGMLREPEVLPPSASDRHAAYLIASRPEAARFPYSARDKFRLFVKDTYDPFNFMGESLQALYNQANGETYKFGGGTEGYGKRLGAIVATDGVGEFFGTFLFSSVLRTDPRYFRMGQGGFFRRSAYAMSRVLIVRKDSGGNTFNAANWLGGIATTAVSNTYYPDRRRGFGPTVQHAAVNIGFDSLYALFREFWPDVAHRLRIPAFVIRRTADPDMPEKPNP